MADVEWYTLVRIAGIDDLSVYQHHIDKTMASVAESESDK